MNKLRPREVTYLFKIIKLVLVDNRCIKCINRAVQRVLWQNRDRPAGKMGNRGVDISEIFPKETVPEQVYSEKESHKVLV